MGFVNLARYHLMVNISMIVMKILKAPKEQSQNILKSTYNRTNIMAEIKYRLNFFEQKVYLNLYFINIMRLKGLIFVCIFYKIII